MTSWIFLRLLGLVYFCAFTSWAVQAIGLIGEHGILPCRLVIDSLPPTLFWFNSSDFSLALIPWLGSFFSIMLLTGFLSGPCTIILWAFYLSIVNAGMDFTGFQWDALLLETGFIAIFLAPWKLWQRMPLSIEPEPPIAIFWLLRFLCFRLMFMSGWVKLASGDLAWQNLTALNYHYETQPLPTPLAWYLNQFPEWFQRFSTGSVLFIELLIPICIFGPRKIRLVAAGFLILLQILIALAGNYAFFNILSIALCITLLDDEFLHFIQLKILKKNQIQKDLPTDQQQIQPSKQSRFGKKTLIAISLAILGGSQILTTIVGYQLVPMPLLILLAAVQPIHIVNNYGLFAVMTTSRPEIIVEGSNDGEHWLAYEFKYKPGDIRRAPPIIAPHQPRLDWQMWFAALGSESTNPWFRLFVKCLLEGRSEVTTLLKTNPFPDSPPLFIRASVYDYHFTDAALKNRNKDWWRHEFKEIYLPTTSLKDFN